MMRGYVRRPERGKPTSPDDGFEPLAPALEKLFRKKFAKLPAELQERITSDRASAWLVLDWDVSTPGQRRSMAQQRDCGADPANKDVADFWFEVPFRKAELETKKVQAQNVAAPDAVALAMRNTMLFYIDEAIDALPKDEEEVRSALPAKSKATVERVRKRWTELDKRALGLRPEDLDSNIPENVTEKSPGGMESQAPPPLLGLREAPAAHEAPEVPELTAAATGAPITRSGAQGRPSSIDNLVRPELERRKAAGETLPTIKAEAEALSKWLANNHSGHPQVRPRPLENSLRSELRAAVSAKEERHIK
jgi:hypothetical protein